MTDCFKMTFVSAVFMAVLISLVFITLILVIVKVNNSHKINKTLSCLAKTQPQPFLYNGILMILCVNVPIFCAYSIIRHALRWFCSTAKHAIVRFFRNSHISLHFWGWSGGAMVLGKLPVPVRPTWLVGWLFWA